jgi:hypothetical protein
MLTTMLPTLGVPEKIPRRDVPFIVVAGLPLTLVFLGVFGAAMNDLGVPPSEDNPLYAIGLVTAFGLGPAIAYYLQRRLRASRVSLAQGCRGLAAWTILLATGAAVLGWLGVGLIGVLGGGAILRLRSGDDVAPSIDAMTPAELGQTRALVTAPSPSREALEQQALAPTVESMSRLRESPETGDVTFYVAVLGAICGIILGGVVGLATDNAGLAAVDNTGLFLTAVAFAAVGMGSIVTFLWDALVGALTRNAPVDGLVASLVVTTLASAGAAVMFMLVAQSLAGPIALLSIGLPVAWLGAHLIWNGIKSTRRSG